jgi:curved DNA-binding protein CbpA
VDLYEILQVSHRADIEVIRAAYRVLARRYHPDVGGDARRMAAVNEAWATLSDPLKRRRYDAKFRLGQASTAVSTEAAPDGVGVMNRRPAPPPAAPSPSPMTARPDPRAPRPAEPAEPAAPGATAARNDPGPAPSGRPGPPPASFLIDFGRYAGWSVSDLSRHDPDYLLWLERTPIGRHLQSEIQRVMELRRNAAAALASRPAAPAVRRNAGGWFR